MDLRTERAAIVALLDLYGVAVDARRWELFDSVFVATARLDYFSSVWTDRATFRSDFARAHEVYSATQHSIGNHVVAITDADRATALSYCQWRLVRPGSLGGDSWWGCAWYDDAMVRLPVGWRIDRRRCGLMWTDGNPRVADLEVAPPCEPLHTAAGSILGRPAHG